MTTSPIDSGPVGLCGFTARRADTASGSYHFTTPQTEQSMTEAATVVKVVGARSRPPNFHRNTDVQRVRGRGRVLGMGAAADR